MTGAKNNLLAKCILAITVCWISASSASEKDKKMKPMPDEKTLLEARSNFEGAAYLNPAYSAEVRAKDVLSRMTLEEKTELVVGFNEFFIAPLPRFGLRAIYLTDASAGMHIRENLFKMDKSVSYPATVALAATWEPNLAQRYGAAISGECRAWGSDVLLGPGVNLYRSSECGRNFEYMGEDPLLAGMMATSYIRGIQSLDIMATGKHFICNNHEWRRHSSDIWVDERALRELYARAWYRMIHEGNVGAVMTSYNLLNGEKSSQSKAVISDFLKGEIGFKGLAMSDWGAVWDKVKAVESGLDLIMPKGQLDPEKTKQFEENLNRMSENILTACFRFGYYDREAKDEHFMTAYPEYEKTALETARRAITLLKNKDQLLPLNPDATGKILVTGPAAEKTPHCGGGSGWVKGYGHTHILGELKKILGDDRIVFSASPTEADLKAAAAVIVCIKTDDKEGTDRPFALDPAQEGLVQKAVNNQPRSIVIINSGGAIRMTDWKEQAGAIVHAYFAGQYGGTAIAEILTGKVNPSGKLPFTMEKEFTDSPAVHDYERSEGVDRTQHGWGYKPPVKVNYNEKIFIGYRWYEKKQIATQYPFGHGLSYTTFDYSDLQVEKTADHISVTLSISNTGSRAGAETVQIYYADPESSVERPNKELCGFRKVDLMPGETSTVTIQIPVQDLTFYDVIKKAWKLEAGEYRLLVGSSSADIRAQSRFQQEQDVWFSLPVAK
ncbi:MAG TPA: glycoside hydrolase family 3 C-terminal domain-containing protein [Pontiella sp.]